MIRSDIFSQAHRGDPKAIAALMNHSLQRKQVTVRAALQGNCLTIVVTSRERPDPQFMSNFVRRGLLRLRPDQVQRVVIRGYAIGTLDSLWTVELDPYSAAPPRVSSARSSGATTSSPQLPLAPRRSPSRAAERSTAQPATPFSTPPTPPATLPAAPSASESRSAMGTTPPAIQSGTQRETSTPKSTPKLAPKSTPKSTTRAAKRAARSRSAPPRSSRPLSRLSSRSSTPSGSRPSGRSPATRSRFSGWLDRGRKLVASLLFVACSLGSVLLAFSCKVWTTRLAEVSIYQIQFLGDLLRGLEAAEIFNIVVFAVLGLGLGLTTALVPRSFGIRVTAAIGLLVLPVIFSVSSIIRYHGWLSEFAETEHLSEAQAIAQTDIYLQERVQRSGVVGFYLHTARYPGLPASRVQMEQIDALDAPVADRLEAAVRQLLGSLPFQLELPQLFTLSMWGIRVFYLLLSLLTAITNFVQAVGWADYLARRSTLTP